MKRINLQCERQRDQYWARHTQLNIFEIPHVITNDGQYSVASGEKQVEETAEDCTLFWSCDFHHCKQKTKDTAIARSYNILLHGQIKYISAIQ